jgi:outer membrane protein assembly factor BamB
MGTGTDHWATDVGSTVTGMVAAGGILCVTCEDSIVALSPADGRTLWTRPYVAPGDPVAVADLVFVLGGEMGTTSATVDVLRAEDGVRVGSFHGADQVQVWHDAVFVWGDGPGSSGLGIHVLRPGSGSGFRSAWIEPSAAVQQVVGGVVFTSGGAVLAGRDGTQLCTYPARLFVQLVVDGVAYLGGPPGGGPSTGVSALALGDGAQLWTFPAASTVLAVSAGVAYLSDSLADDPAVYAVRVRDGARLWTLRTVSLGSPSLAVDRNVVYLGTGSSLAAMAEGGGGRVRALLAGTGTELWSFPTLGDSPASLIAAPGVIYIYDGGLNSMGAGSGGRITAVRARDGARLWSLQTGGSNTQLFQADGVIYATVSGPFPAVGGATPGTATDGKVCAVRPGSGALIWSLTVPWADQAVPLPMTVDQGIAAIADGQIIRGLGSR